MIWPPDIKAAEAIEAGVQVVMPGMVNTHAHISASAISGEASAAEHVIVFPFSGQPVPAGFAD